MSSPSSEVPKGQGAEQTAAERPKTFPPPTSPESELLRLRNVAQGERIISSDLMKVYGTERALARIADSELSEGMVLKGGYLLRHVLPNGVRRSTVDADFFCNGMDKAQVVEQLGKVLTKSNKDDHVTFDMRSLKAEPMQEDQGLRVTFKGNVGKAVIDGMLDLGFEAALVPGAERRQIPSMLRHAAAVNVSAYAIETVVAEKYETIFRRGVANTRLKDYYDLAMLSRHQSFDGRRLCAAIAATCDMRGTEILQGSPKALGLPYTTSSENVAAWDRLKGRAPMVGSVTLQQSAEDIWRFLQAPTERLAAKQSFEGTWNPKTTAWEPTGR